jgi:hypothetical protein
MQPRELERVAGVGLDPGPGAARARSTKAASSHARRLLIEAA